MVHILWHVTPRHRASTVRLSAYHLASSFKRQTVQEERFKSNVVLPFQTSRMNNPDTQRSIPADHVINMDGVRIAIFQHRMLIDIFR